MKRACEKELLANEKQEYLKYVIPNDLEGDNPSGIINLMAEISDAIAG